MPAYILFGAVKKMVAEARVNKLATEADVGAQSGGLLIWTTWNGCSKLITQEDSVKS
jgi:hypothetical protein